MSQLNSMPHGVDTVNHLPLNMLELLPLSRLIIQLSLLPKLMLLNIKNQDQDLESKDSPHLNGSLMDNHLIIMEEELKVPLLVGLKRRFLLLQLNKLQSNNQKKQFLKTKLQEFSSLKLLILLPSKLSKILAKLQMILFLLILSVLMLLKIMELL